MSNESSPISGMAKNVKRRDTIRRLSIHAFLSSIPPRECTRRFSHDTIPLSSLLLATVYFISLVNVNARNAFRNILSSVYRPKQKRKKKAKTRERRKSFY